MSLLALKGVDVVVLAGGLGSRVRSLLGDTPKVLAPIKGRTFLDYLLDQLKDLGAERVILSIGHLSEKIEEHLKTHTSSLQIETVIEPEPLGTGGAVRHAMSHLKCKRVVVMNGDTWLLADYAAFMKSHIAAQKIGSILCVRVHDASRYGSIKIDNKGSIAEFVEKGQTKGEGIISGGVYIFERQALEALQKIKGPSLERDFLATMKSGLLHGYVADDAVFIDIGTPEMLKSAEGIISKSAVQLSSKKA